MMLQHVMPVRVKPVSVKSGQKQLNRKGFVAWVYCLNEAFKVVSASPIQNIHGLLHSLYKFNWAT